MYIQANTGTRRLTVRQDGDVYEAEFDEDGKARVTREVGEFLSEVVDGVTILDYETED